MPACVEYEVPMDLMTAAEAVIEVDASSWAVEEDIVDDSGAAGLGLN